MANDPREQLESRLIERLTKAIPGESRETVRQRYQPVFNKMTDAELSLVRQRIASHSDSQLYLADEKIYRLLLTRGRSPLVGKYVALVFDSTFTPQTRSR